MKRGKRDANHAELKAAFEELGCSVFDAADVGMDFPDLVIGLCRRTVLVEVKTEDGDLLPGQKFFLETWRGDTRIARNRDDAIAIVQEIRREVRGIR